MNTDADDIFMTKADLMDRLENETKVFTNPAVKDAFVAIDRKDFLDEDYKVEAYEDYPLPTFDGQTISQPTTVAFMLDLLDVQKGDMVLDIGSGSGWTTALLAHMAGSEGKVIGLEIIPELVKISKKNLEKYQNNKDASENINVEIHQATQDAGLFTEGPYNRIIASAAFATKEDAPAELVFQLTEGGVMVLPIGDSLWKFHKISEDEIEETEYPGFSFVPYEGSDTSL